MTDGETGAPIFQLQFVTAPPHEPPVRITKARVAVFLLIVLAVGAFAWKRLRKEEEVWQIP